MASEYQSARSHYDPVHNSAAVHQATPEQSRLQPPQQSQPLDQSNFDFAATPQQEDQIHLTPHYHPLLTDPAVLPFSPRNHHHETSMKQKGTRRRKNLTTKPEVVDDGYGNNNSDSPQHLVTNSLTSTAPRQVLIKTKFPVARIKRIMQADEDVGKVAQVTPVVVSKALELFMIALCDKASEQARQRHSKRITAGHLKQAIIHEEQFDFLADIIEKVPDTSLPPDGSSLTNVAIDSEDGIPVKRTRKPRQRKTKDEDAF